MVPIPLSIGEYKSLLTMARLGHFDLWVDNGIVRIALYDDDPGVRHLMNANEVRRMLRRGYYDKWSREEDHRNEVLRRRKEMQP